jgi:ankyrin repeat protein
MTALHYAAESNTMVDAIPALVAAGIPPDIRDVDDDTPLHFAARGNAGRAARALLDAGANPNSLNEEGLTPLQVAIEEDRLNSVAALVRAAAIDMTVKYPDGRSILAKAILLKQDAIAMELVTHGYAVADWTVIARAAKGARLGDLYDYALSKVRSSS